MYEDIRIKGHLVARIDREKRLIEIKQRSIIYVLDLNKYLGLSVPRCEEEPITEYPSQN